MANYYPTTIAELITAIEDANDDGGGTIYLVEDGIYTVTQPYTYPGASDPSLNAFPIFFHEINIEGRGAIIERSPSADPFRFFEVNLTTFNSNLSIKELTLRGGEASSAGGAISVLSNTHLTLADVVFENNQSSLDAGALSFIGGSNHDITMDRVTFSNNKVAAGSGALALYSPRQTIIRDCHFYKNKSVESVNGHGVGLWFGTTGETITIQRSTFVENIGKRFGNIHIIGGDISITHCVFQKNLALDDADPYYAHSLVTDGSGSATVKNNEFLDNFNPAAPGMSSVVNYMSTNDYEDNFWGDFDGPSGLGSGLGDYLYGGVSTYYIPYVGYEGPDQEGQISCPVSYGGDDAITSENPISLLKAEKRVDALDLQLNTPAGTLAFQRHYRQHQKAEQQFMGLGWNHNHRQYLAEGVDARGIGEITVMLATSKVKLFQVAANLYEGKAGSASILEKDDSGTLPVYMLTASDETVYRFEVLQSGDTVAWLTQRTLPTGEVWDYSYDGNNRLVSVEDTYDVGGSTLRSLQFVYYSGLSGADAFKNGQLWRVGDHNTTGLSVTPTGRYVEFDYSPQQSDGTAITSPKALLTSVRDVRGYTHTYRYYGSQSGETDTDQLDKLLERQSPAMADNGNMAYMLEEVAYTLDMSGEITAIHQERGDGALVTDFTFNTDETTLTQAGRVTTHDFNNGVYLGMSDPANNQMLTNTKGNYRPASQQDANGNQTSMEWNPGGKTLSKVTDALNNETAFSYDEQDRLIASEDAQARFTSYVYESTQRQPSHILVADAQAVELAVNGDMEANSDWSAVGSSTQNQSTVQVENGDYSWYVDAASGDGLESAAALSLAQDKSYLLAARVYVVNSGEQIKMKLSGSTDWDTLSQEDGQWESLLAIHTPTAASTLKLQFLAEGGAAEFYVDSVHVFELENLHRWQHFVYDEKRRVLLEALVDQTDATLLQSTERVYGTSGNGNGLLESITVKDLDDPLNDQTTVYTYDEVGRVVKTNKTSMLGSCQFTYTVYDEAGHVVASLCSTASYTPPTTVAEAVALYDAADAVKKHNRVTTHEYDELGRKIATTSDAGATFARTSRTLYDALGRVTRSIQNYVAQGSSAPGDWVFENGQWLDGAGGTPIVHGAAKDQNLISDTAYNARGLVASRQDVLGRVTLYGYDLADRLVKTIQNAQTPAYDASYATGDPDLSAYVEDTSIADGDVITEQVYDAAGNLVQSVDARGMSSFTIYDALNRPVKTVQNAKATATIALNPGDTGYDAALDPRSASYVISTEPDRDQISTTEYDSMGRVVRTARLLENRGASEEWDQQYMVYDALGRQVRSIQHYVEQTDSGSAVVTPDNWVWSVSNGRWELSATDTTPVDLGDNDQNIISETVYDNQGRLRQTLDVNRVLTRMVYDGLNRQVKTVGNYVAQSTDPAEWVWSATNDRWELSSSDTTAVDHGTNKDQNIISETIYDSDGRVEGSRDVEGLLSRNAYDSLGRQALTVQNFVDNSYADPANWVWDTGQTPHRWEDGSGTAIDRGTGFDQNLIRQPEYDDETRVIQTRDVRGNLTRQVYDTSGRQVMSIANYVPQATEPENWIWRESFKRWEDGSGTAIDFGVDNDQNRISSTKYDLLGRVASSRGAAGRETVFVYDGLDRRVRAVNNYRASSNPTEWVWSTANTRWEVSATDTTAIQHGSAFDRNHISDTIYNKAGQVTESRDTRGTVTAFVYDDAGRRLQVTRASGTALASSSYTCFDKAGRVLKQIANYAVQGSSDPYEWVLESGDWKQAASGTAIVHGVNKDQNLITLMAYDQASRRISTTNAEGDISTTSYFLDGQVDRMTDPEGTVTVYRYDALRRRTLVVQSYINVSSQYTDPSTWSWNGSDWEDDASTPVTISHGTDKDENIIVALAYDSKGRMTQMRDPRGEVISYEYDALGRRTKLTNPLAQDWITAYAEADGATETTMTYPGLNGGGSYDVVRSFDRMGRLQSIDYGDPANTYDVQMAYDVLGNRLSMRELGSSAALQRETHYSYDEADRLQEVGFDTDGDSSIEETVRYSYDTGGNRTRLRLPDGLEVTYSYDAKGRLQSLSDWDSQQSDFSYDGADRHIQTERDSTIRSSYAHDLAGRLTQLHHEDISGTPTTLAQYDFSVDGRGNRTQAVEQILQVGGSTPVSTTIDYSYDALSRLKQADYDSGTTVYNYGYDVAGNLVNMNGVTRTYNAANQMTNDGTNTLTYDANGNLTNDGVSAYVWDRANRMVSNGSHSYAYDGSGNRIQQTVSSVVTDYLLDLQPALAKVIGDSDGNRFVHGPRGIHMQQSVTVGSVPQWGQVNWGAFNWGGSMTSGISEYLLQDGLGSVRSVVDASATVLQTHSYDPYGNYLGTAPTDAYFGFTGEQTDENDNIYLRARYMNPNMGTFLSLDPFEGIQNRPMSLNGYSWVEGNIVMNIDPTGMTCGCEQYLQSGNVFAYLSCSEPSLSTHVYNRSIAARTAWNLARKGAGNTVHIGQLNAYSAMFISLVLYAGGLPMTNSGGSESYSTNRGLAKGWRANMPNISPNTIQANDVWLNHNNQNSYDPAQDDRLLGYLFGSTNALNGIGVYTSGSAQTGEIAVGEVIDNPNMDNARINFTDLAMLINSRRLDQVQQGDYLFINSTPDATHGYIVVGFGAALPCNFVEAEQSSISLQADDVHISLPDGVPFDAIGQRIPYVADWSGTSQRSIVPFYCSQPEFNHTYWNFIKVPDVTAVERTSLYTSNMRILPNGDIFKTFDQD